MQSLVKYSLCAFFLILGFVLEFSLLGQNGPEWENSDLIKLELVFEHQLEDSRNTGTGPMAPVELEEDTSPHEYLIRKRYQFTQYLYTSQKAFFQYNLLREQYIHNIFVPPKILS